jgi:hypothetical protein
MTETTAKGIAPRPLILMAVFAGILFAAALALWGYFGTAVFYEMVLAGLAACF